MEVRSRNCGLKSVVLFGLAGVVAETTRLPGCYLPTGSSTPAFFVSLGIISFVLLALTRRWVHGTAAALAGVMAVWLVTYVGGTFFPALHLLDFDEAMAFVDWNVVLLILALMIFVAVFGETGVLRWLAVRAFRLARGNAWLLVRY
jgi:Na+/H+ antiporter NhaD/arsenite permease-like protein